MAFFPSAMKNVTLELSAKAFCDDTAETAHVVCRRLFEQWRALTEPAERVSVLLWIADGSEILEYSGDLSDRFEWAYWCGVANHCPQPEKPTERQLRNTFAFPKKYREDARPRSYRWLKELIDILKETGRELLGKEIRVGATFDNGPEFALSEFKYQRHAEIAQANTIYPHSFVTCTARLHADTRRYAAYPGGIPEGTPFGEFFGRQLALFARDLGYDYIWLSNGMGFGTETWGITGALFDKERFYPERKNRAQEALLDFWRRFKTECPALPIETRGSNFSAGVEIASDACPLDRIFADGRVVPPVNSPWAALDNLCGLELAAWMSHNAVASAAAFLYRFYVHDPWFLNSPWLDRYGREPWDIYLPLSVCRLDAEGAVQTPDSLAVFTADDTSGAMPDQVPQEVQPHLLEALRTSPDAPGPLVWVYPFQRYCDCEEPEKIFAEDFFIGEAIQAGLPLNTVVSAENLRGILSRNDGKLLGGSVLVIPLSVLDDRESLSRLRQFLEEGGHALFYGAFSPKTPSEVADLLGIDPLPDDALVGEVAVECAPELPQDDFACGELARRMTILPQFDAGGVTERTPADRKDIAILATIHQGDEIRTIAQLRCFPSGGSAGFVRVLQPCAPKIDQRWCGFDRANAATAFPAERLMRFVLAQMGWRLLWKGHDCDCIPPMTCISRHDNAFWFSIHAPDSAVEMHVDTPLGVPILTEMETEVAEGGTTAIWHPGKSWHKECRCFVRQTCGGVVHAKTGFVAFPGYHGRRHYEGLQNATLRFFPPTGYETSLEATSPAAPWELLSENLIEPIWEQTPLGLCARFDNITGRLFLAW